MSALRDGGWWGQLDGELLETKGTRYRAVRTVLAAASDA